MNMSLSNNPFTRPAFWGREKELSIIVGRLLSDPPQSIPIIGEPYIGKSTLVRYLMKLPLSDDETGKSRFSFAYLDCQPYIRRADEMPDRADYATARFWWDVYNALPKNLPVDEAFSEPRWNDAADLLQDRAYDISTAVERAIRHHDRPVIFIFDNFEGIAYLPWRNSDWLRYIAITTGKCAFIVTSRYALYVLYSQHPASLNNPSPLWNIFSDPIYLGLLPEKEVNDYLVSASAQAAANNSYWQPRDIAFIRGMAGRHQELLRIACARMFEERLSSPLPAETAIDQPDYNFLALRIVQDATPICKQLWQGLTNPALNDLPGSSGVDTAYQETLAAIARGCSSTNTGALFKLEQRGLIEYVDNEWHVFADVMRRFVLAQEQPQEQPTEQPIIVTPTIVAQQPAASSERDDDKPLTYKEGKVYEYLKTRLEEVCDRTEIMQAVWEDGNKPSNSALQKIIERIRKKIEDDPNSPYKLIAVRGRGYMLRKAL